MDTVAVTLPIAGFTALAAIDKGARLLGNRVLESLFERQFAGNAVLKAHQEPLQSPTGVTELLLDSSES